MTSNKKQADTLNHIFQYTEEPQKLKIMVQ